jgi:hypothetical protein
MITFIRFIAGPCLVGVRTGSGGLARKKATHLQLAASRASQLPRTAATGRDSKAPFGFLRHDGLMGT